MCQRVPFVAVSTVGTTADVLLISRTQITSVEMKKLRAGSQFEVNVRTVDGAEYPTYHNTEDEAMIQVNYLCNGSWSYTAQAGMGE